MHGASLVLLDDTSAQCKNTPSNANLMNESTTSLTFIINSASENYLSAQYIWEKALFSQTTYLDQVGAKTTKKEKADRLSPGY